MTPEDDFPATSSAEITDAARAARAAAWVLFGATVGLGFLAAFARDLLADTGWFG